MILAKYIFCLISDLLKAFSLFFYSLKKFKKFKQIIHKQIEQFMTLIEKVKVFRIICEFKILRLTFHRK